MNFKELFTQIKSGSFSTILTLLELSSSVLDSVYIGQDTSTANLIVNSMVNVASVRTLFGWDIKFVVLMSESSAAVFKNALNVVPCINLFILNYEKQPPALMTFQISLTINCELTCFGLKFRDLMSTSISASIGKIPFFTTF